jgi:hypothetical protein
MIVYLIHQLAIYDYLFFVKFFLNEPNKYMVINIFKKSIKQIKIIYKCSNHFFRKIFLKIDIVSQIKSKYFFTIFLLESA